MFCCGDFVSSRRLTLLRDVSCAGEWLCGKYKLNKFSEEPVVAISTLEMEAADSSETFVKKSTVTEWFGAVVTLDANSAGTPAVLTFCDFPQFLLTYPGSVSLLSHDRFLPSPFQFIIHPPTGHCYCAVTDDALK
jgi:hypothetical protein